MIKMISDTRHDIIVFSLYCIYGRDFNRNFNY